MNTPILSFTFNWVDDGTSGTMQIDTVSGPIILGSSSPLPPTLNLRAAVDIDGSLSTYPSTGITVTKSSFSHGILTLSLSGGTRTAGQQLMIQGGYFVF